MEGVNGSLNFIIDKDIANLVKNHKPRVNHLFGVTVKLEKPQKDKQWINIKGSEDQLYKAKDYIIALVKPEITTTLKNVWGNPLFTKARHADIEKRSAAVLSRYDDGSNDGLQIQGTAFSVTVARSLIDEVFSKNALDIFDGQTSLDEQMILDGDEEDDDCIVTDVKPGVILRGGSSTLAEPQLDKLNKMFQDQLGSALKAKQGDTLPTLSPHGREQQAYLRNMALALKHDKGIVEEALAKFDMNEIIRPANFINAVEEIAGKKGKKNKQKSKTNAGCAASHTDLDASVICMDSSDEETYVMRPFGHVAEAQRQADSENAIVLSSDEEQENERPSVMRTRQQSSHFKASSTSRNNNSQISCSSVIKGPPCPAPRPFVEQIFAGNHGPKNGRSPPGILAGKATPANPASGLLARNATSGNPRSGLIAEKAISDNQAANFSARATIVGNPISDIPVGNITSVKPTSSLLQGGSAVVDHHLNPGFENSDEAQLRQEYIDSLMAASPKGPRRGLRYIVIDGSNVAMNHGNSKHFSVHGLEICIKFFLSRGHKDITAFVPEWRRYAAHTFSGAQVSAAGRALLEKLNKAGFVKFTPARRVGNRTIASYDDRFILNLAIEEEGIIVSNDQYRDLHGERESYKDVVTKHLLQFTFVGNHFMPPEDPLGRFGPPLDQFLRHPEPPQRSVMKPTMASTAMPRTCQDVAMPESGRFLPQRSPSETEKLFLELIKVFSEPHQMSCVRRVLENHKRENDLDRLSDYCINAMT